MLDSFYLMTLKCLRNLVFGVKNVKNVSLCMQLWYERHYITLLSKPLVVYQF